MPTWRAAPVRAGKGRREYNRLYEDLEQNRFDVVVIKSQDRLMRNTRDWYLFSDRLNCAGKRLYFYLENTFYSPEDALLTGIKAILAEEYSRELSKKMNLAHQKRQQNNGKPVLTSKVMVTGGRQTERLRSSRRRPQ